MHAHASGMAFWTDWGLVLIDSATHRGHSVLTPALGVAPECSVDLIRFPRPSWATELGASLVETA